MKYTILYGILAGILVSTCIEYNSPNFELKSVAFVIGFAFMGLGMDVQCEKKKTK